MNRNQIIAKNTFTLSVRMFAVLAISLYATRVILCSLGVEEYGIYNVVAGFVAMFSFLNTSISNGIQRFFNYEFGRSGREGALKVFNTSLVIQLILSALVVVILETFGIWYINSIMNVPEGRLVAVNWLFQISVVSSLFTIAQAPFVAAIMAHERMNFYSLVYIIEVIFKLLIALLLTFCKGDLLVIYGALYLAISVITFAFYLIYSKKNFEEVVITFKCDFSLFKSMLTFSGWNLVGSFANIMKEQGLNMILNLFFGPIVNAARGVSFQVLSGLNSFVANVNTATRPQIVQTYAQGDSQRTFQLFYSSSKLSFMALWVFAYPITLEIKYVLSLWLGTNVPVFADVFIIWVLLAAAMGDLNGPVSAVVHATGKMKKYQIVSSLVSLWVVPVCYIMYKIGYEPVWGFVISFLFSVINQVICIVILKSLTGLKLLDYSKSVIVPLLLTLLTSFLFPIIPSLIMKPGLLRFVIVCAVSIITTVFFYFLIGMNKSEQNISKSLVYTLLNNVRK